ncbi:MAG: helix-turn-helix domain-containing protein [Thalassovita sp.]
MTPSAFCIHKSFPVSEPTAFQSDQHYLLYAREGTLRLEAQGQRWTLPPARAALIHANQAVEITVLSPLTSASVLFDAGFMDPPSSGLSVFDVTPLARELIHACRHLGPDRAPDTPYHRSLLTALAQVALRLSQTPCPCVMPQPKSQALKNALDLTATLAQTPLSFVTIAAQTGQSPRALTRRFASELGMTWREALRRIRIIRAVEALSISNAPVTEIALGVGYQSISAFNAAFRDLIGMSPTAYRASFKTRPEEI